MGLDVIGIDAYSKARARRNFDDSVSAGNGSVLLSIGMVNVADQTADRLVGKTAQHVENGKLQSCDLDAQGYVLAFDISLRGVEDQLIQVACIFGEEPMPHTSLKHGVAVLRYERMPIETPSAPTLERTRQMKFFLS